MSVRGAPIEAGDQPNIQIPFIYRGPVPANGKVYVEITPQGEPPFEVELTKGASGAFESFYELPDGQKFSCRFGTRDGNNATIWQRRVISGEARPVGAAPVQGQAPAVVPGAPHAPTAPHAPSAAPNAAPQGTPATLSAVQDLQNRISRPMKEMVGLALQGSTDKNAPKTMEAYVRQIELQLDAARRATGLPEIAALNGNFTSVVSKAYLQVISEHAGAPHDLKTAVAGIDLNTTPFDQLTTRLVDATKHYRERVFTMLMTNPKAIKLFKLKNVSQYNPDNPLGDPVWNKIFFKICESRDLGNLHAPIGSALSAATGLAKPLGPSPATVDRQTALSQLTKTVKRRVAPNAAARKIDIGNDLVGGLTSLLYSGAIGVTMLSKGAIESLSGVTVSDLLDGDKDSIGQTAATRNIFSAVGREWKVRKEGGSVKELLKSRLLHAIPGYSYQSGGHDIQGGNESTSDKIARELITEAVNKAA